MQYLDLSLPSPEQNLACDEALLDQCEAGEGPEVLRFWEPGETFVVVGYANRVAVEVDEAACGVSHIPVLRRISGGGGVLQARGCLNYTLVLRTERVAALATIAQTNAFILERHRAVLAQLLGAEVTREGGIDLTLGNRKFSGNAQRRARRAVLFHGTFLLHLDLARVACYLRMPSRAPAYRRQRAHQDFLTNLGVEPARIKQALRSSWGANHPAGEVPRARIAELVQRKYSQADWNLRF